MKKGTIAGRNLRLGLSLDILTADEVDEIHLATLDVLEFTGIAVDHDEALDIFAQAGAHVNRQTKVVKIPPSLVEDAIGSAPCRVVLAGKDPKHDLMLESSRVHFTNFSEGVIVADPYTGEHREPKKSDLSNATRVIDFLDDVDFCEKALGAHDVDQRSAPLHNAEAILPFTTKHCAFGPGNGRLLHKIIQMAATIVGGEDKLKERPIVSFTTCPVSPLRLVKECCEIIMESARTGMACNILSMAMAGGTAPVTLAGTLVTHNAELLGGITLHQLTRKGAPVIYGSSTTAMDLRLGAASVGTPEAALVSGAVARLARYYKIPSYVGGT